MPEFAEPEKAADESIRRGGPEPEPRSSRLQVGSVSDPAERAADAVAARVVRQLVDARRAPVGEGQQGRVRKAPADAGPGSDATGGSTKPVTGRVRRSGGVVGPEGGPVDATTEREIGRVRRSGTPLDPGVRSPMEQALSADLGRVRIHTGSAADRVSRSLGAEAFTVGNDIVFSNDAYDPTSHTGQRVLAHELAHVVQGDSSVRRLWGFGNTGRTEDEERAILKDARAGAGQLADQVKATLRPSTTTGRAGQNSQAAAVRAGDYDTFNRLVRLLARIDVDEIATKYAKTARATLGADIDEAFGGGTFRARYLRSLVSGKGVPDPVLRVRLALGSGGKGAAGFTSDQPEALRLIGTLTGPQLLKLCTDHDAELKTGLSGKAYLQVQAMHDQQKAVAPATAGQPVNPGGSAPSLTGDAALKFLEGADRSLGKIVSRAMKGESTTFYDKLTVKATVNREQLVADVTTWVARAKADEATHFGGRPTIRQYVLGRKVDVGTAAAPRKVSGREFVERMARRNALVGWNDGDRLMVRLLVAGGTVADAAGDTAAQQQAKETESAATAGLANVGLDARIASNDRLKVVEAAVTRATDPDVIAALSALAAEIVVQQKRAVQWQSVRSGADRAVAALLKLDSSKRIPLYAALLGAGKSNGPIQPNDLDVAYNRFVEAMSAAGIKLKEQARITARLVAEMSSDAYQAMRRYAGKSDDRIGGFKPDKFAQLVAKLSPAEVDQAKQDGALLRMLKAHPHLGRDPLSVAAKAFQPGQTQPGQAQPGQAQPGQAQPGQTQPGQAQPGQTQPGQAQPGQAQTGQTQTGAAEQQWADRWSLFITSSKSEKKIYSFALRIYDDGGSDRLHGAYRLLSDDAKRRLRGMGLGAALEQGTKIGGGASEYDLVAKIVQKAETARPNGDADIATIASAFETLKGAKLLDEWTNIADYTKPGGDVAKRRQLLQAIALDIPKIEAIDAEISQLERDAASQQSEASAKGRERKGHEKTMEAEKGRVGRREATIASLQTETAARDKWLTDEGGSHAVAGAGESELDARLTKAQKSLGSHQTRLTKATADRDAARAGRKQAKSEHVRLGKELDQKRQDRQALVTQLDLPTKFGKVERLNQQLGSTLRIGMRSDRRDLLNTGVKQLKTPEYFSVMRRFADHLAAEMGDGPTRTELMARGFLPNELVAAGGGVQFVASQAKEANLATWHQWSLVTVRGQLREESSGLLTRQLGNLERVAGDRTKTGTDLDQAREDFTAAREELTERSATFEATAKKYAARLKKLVELLLDVIIIGATLGIGALPVAINAAVQAAMALGKEIIVAVVDKVLMPSESNLLSVAGIATAKAGLKAALSIGLAQLDALLREQLNLIDAKGLGAGNYVDPTTGSTWTSTALSADMAQYWGGAYATRMVTGVVNKLGNRLIEAFVDSLTTAGPDAWRQLVKNWNWQDAVDVAFGPMVQELLGRLRTEMMSGIGPQSQTQMVNGVEHTEITDKSGSLTFADASKVAKTTDATFGQGLAALAQEQTVISFLERVAGLPAATLDAQLKLARQQGDAVDVDSVDGPSRASTKSEEAKLWAQLAKAAGQLPPGGAGDLVVELLKLRKP